MPVSYEDYRKANLTYPKQSGSKLRFYKRSDDYDALLNDARGIKFWRKLSPEEHERERIDCQLDRGNSNCCFWHIIGGHVKHNEEKPLFDYQQISLRALEIFSKIRIKKFRGAGMTQLWLEYASWLALNSNRYRYQDAFFITGINQRLANDHILKIKRMFQEHYPGAIEYMDYTKATITLNDSMFFALPARNPNAPRGKSNVFWILLDEFDFHTRNDQMEMESTIKPYRAKSGTILVLNSTTKNANGRYVDMDREWDSMLSKLNIRRHEIDQTDLLNYDPINPDHKYIGMIRANLKHHFYLLEFDWHWGVNPPELGPKIYTMAEIREVEDDVIFPSEFCLEYQSHLGNFFNQDAITRCLTDSYNPDDVFFGPLRCMGVDPGLGTEEEGTALTGICIWELRDGFICALEAEEYETPTHDDIVDLINKKSKQFIKMHKYYLDGSNTEIVREVKEMISEDTDRIRTKELMAQARKMHVKYDQLMDVVPFQTSEVGAMLIGKLKSFIERPKPRIKIHPRFKKLEDSLRTAYGLKIGVLDKKATNNVHLFDAARYAIYFFD